MAVQRYVILAWKGLSFTASRGLSSLFQALSLVLLARSIPPEEFGKVASLLGIVLFLIVFFDFGLSGTILRYGRLVNEQADARKFVRSASSTSILVVFLLLLIVAGLCLSRLGQVNVLLLSILPVWSVVERFTETIIAIQIAEKKLGSATQLIVLKRFSSFAAQAGLLLVGFEGVEAFSYSLALSVILSILFLFTVRLEGFRWFGGYFKFPKRESLGIWISSSCTQSRELEVPLIQATVGPFAAGIYGVVSKLQKPASLLAVSLAQLLLPRSSSDSNAARVDLKRIVMMTALVCLASIPVAFYASDLIVLLVGDTYLPFAEFPAQVAILLSSPFAFSASVGAILQGLGHSEKVAWVSFLTAVSSLLIVLLLSSYGLAAIVVALNCAYSIKFLILAAIGWQLSKAD